MSYTLYLREAALNEFNDAYIWYEEQQDGLGNAFRKRIHAKLKKISTNPLLYKKFYKNFHEALIDKFPFVII